MLGKITLEEEKSSSYNMSNLYGYAAPFVDLQEALEARQDQPASAVSHHTSACHSQ